MPKIGSIKQKELIKYIKKLGFKNMNMGSKHRAYSDGQYTVYIPNPHHKDIERGLLKSILKQGNIDIKIWKNI